MQRIQEYEMAVPEAFARQVLDNPESAPDVEAGNDIHLRFADIGRAYGFTYECSKGHKHVIVNDSRSPKQQEITYFHEAHHALVVLPAKVAETKAERYSVAVAGRRAVG